MFIIVKKY